jgi:hypothetical protein
VLYRSAISHNIFFVGVDVCFCNLRCLVQYVSSKKSASEITKITTLLLSWHVAYTEGMSFFVQATPPPKPKTKNIQSVSLLAASIIAVMTIAQLFTFENFPAVIANLWLPGGDATARLIAAVLVIAEVLALPFLLAMRLSPLFRIVSMYVGWLVALIWIFISFGENMMVGSISNNGMFGATIPLPVGWWNVFFSLALGVLVLWASWGMWPTVRRKRKKNVVPSKV